MKNIRFIAITLIFSLLIGGTSLALIFKESDDISEWERRRLQQFPKISAETLMSGKFMREFETYLTDQFPLRNELRTLKAKVHFDLFAQKDNGGIYIKDGHASKLDPKISTSSVNRFTEKMTSLYESYLKGTDCKVYYSIIPDKNRFLTSDGSYPGFDYGEMYRLIDEDFTFMTKIEIEDLLSIEDYYRTDTHWRQEKITDVAQRIRTAMGNDKEVAFETKAMGDFYGVYYGQSALPLDADEIVYLTNEQIDSCKVYNLEKNKTTGVYEDSHYKNMDPYDVYLGGAVPFLEITNPKGEEGKELVLFRDSFGSSLSPLLIDSYSKITLIDTRYIDPRLIKEYVTFDTQDVLFIYSTLLINSSIALK